MRHQVCAQKVTSREQRTDHKRACNNWRQSKQPEWRMRWLPQVSLCWSFGLATGFPVLIVVLCKKTKKGTRKRQTAYSQTGGKMKMTRWSQGKGLTVTSACDLGQVCHLGPNLLHAVLAQGAALFQQAHTCTNFHHCIPSFSTINDSEPERVLYAPLGVVC